MRFSALESMLSQLEFVTTDGMVRAVSVGQITASDAHRVAMGIAKTTGYFCYVAEIRGTFAPFYGVP